MAVTEIFVDQNVVKKERLPYIDLVKTIAIFIVCFYHYNNLQMNFLQNHSFFAFFNYFLRGMFSICVPLFFVCNGYLYLNAEYDIKKHVKKTVKIFFLTIFWSLISVLIVGSILGHKYNILNFLLASYFLEYKVADHLWYMQALFCIYLFFPIIKEAYDKEDKSSFYLFGGIVFFFTFVGVFVNNFSNLFQFMVGINKIPGDFYFLKGYNPFLGFIAYPLVYFFIGGLLKKYVDNKEKYCRFFSAKLLTSVFIMSALVLFLYGLIVSNVDKTIYDNVWTGYDTMATLFMTVSVFLLISKLKYENNKINDFIKLIGSNTLGIYLIHRISGAFFMKYFLLLPFNNNLITNTLFAIFITLFSLAMVLIIKKIPLLKKSVEI